MHLRRTALGVGATCAFKFLGGPGILAPESLKQARARLAC